MFSGLRSHVKVVVQLSEGCFEESICTNLDRRIISAARPAQLLWPLRCSPRRLTRLAHDRPMYLALPLLPGLLLLPTLFALHLPHRPLRLLRLPRHFPRLSVRPPLLHLRALTFLFALLRHPADLQPPLLDLPHCIAIAFRRARAQLPPLELLQPLRLVGGQAVVRRRDGRTRGNGRAKGRDDGGDDVVHGAGDAQAMQRDEIADDERRVGVVDQVVGVRGEVLVVRVRETLLMHGSRVGGVTLPILFSHLRPTIRTLTVLSIFPASITTPVIAVCGCRPSASRCASSSLCRNGLVECCRYCGGIRCLRGVARICAVCHAMDSEVSGWTVPGDAVGGGVGS
nr:hypothetical protein CFP56_19574 [Quercus suber]